MSEFVSPEYQLQLDGLAETLSGVTRKRLAEAALEDTVEFPVVTQDMLFDYDEQSGNIVRGTE